MAAERVLKSLAAAILFSGTVTSAFAQQLDAAAPSPEPQLIIDAVVEVVSQVRGRKMSSPPKLVSVAPILLVADMRRALDYYTRVLGFEIEWAVGEPTSHASVARDGVEISLTAESAPVPSRIYIEVDGVDEYFARVAAAGAKVVVPLGDRFYGMRDGRIDDPDGNSIQLGESLIKS